MKAYPTVVLIALLGAEVVMPPAQAEPIVFHRAFAPQEGRVSRYEEPARQEICLNGAWRFEGDSDTSVPGEAPEPKEDWEKTPIRIPSPWNVNTFSMTSDEKGGDFRAYPSYPKAWDNLSAAWMEKRVKVPKDWQGKQLILRFGAVAGHFVAYVNGQRAGDGFDVFFAQEFDVTDLIHPGKENEILVKVISPKVFDQPGRYGHREYLSGSFWGTHIAGIWQDVFLLAEPETSISDVFVQSWVDRDELTVQATLANHQPHPVAVVVSGSVFQWINRAGRSVEEAPEVKWKLADKPSLGLAAQSATLAAGESRIITLKAKVDHRLRFWSPEQPNLYGLLLKVSAGGKPVDVKYQRFGWRQFTIKGNQLLLNGDPIVLRGDSWHFLGVPQMTRRYAYAWYQLLKDAGANAVRLHASVYPSFYHDMADEMGIMILDETAIWLSDGGPKADSDLFWANCRTHVAELIQRDRNHPSVFGWSVCNEALPVLRNVWHAPQTMIDHCLDQISAWADICRANDPTREWISGDGEFDANGRLPVISIHYGGDGEMKRAAGSGKPWGVGETSMAYYGTPKQVSKFNGNRAYESVLGRMEGLAYECNALVRSQQKFGASYQSVFNIVWYGIQPLPLGKRNLARPIASDEGVFFEDHHEGVPGMEPERLGPYCSTLNPGYDPALPLYRPWPMFDAIRDANLKKTDSPWSENPSAAAEPAPAPRPKNVVPVYLVENGNRLVHDLSRAGIPAVPYADEKRAGILLIDGSAIVGPAPGAALQHAVAKTLEEGGTVWIWNVTQASAPAISQLLGGEVLAEPRIASSFVVKRGDASLAPLNNAAFYFSEADDWRQSSFGLGGAFVQSGQTLLEACPADWRQWNYKAEPVKTAAVYRSEVENTNARAIIVAHALQTGQVILCSLNPQINSARKEAIIERLFRNRGVEPGPVAAQNEFVDPAGELERALVCGSFGFNDAKEAYTGIAPAGEIKPGARINRRRWAAHDANSEGVFDFTAGLVSGPQENAFAYLAVWIKSPKPLNDLLSEPNLPKLSFTYGSDDGCELWLNGELLASHERQGPLEPAMFSQNPLLLKLGWNQMVIKVVQITGDWKFTGRFDCTDKSFLDKLEFATEKPE